MQAEPLISWPEPAIELAGFIGRFLAAGAIGFRFAAMRKLLGNSGDEHRALYLRAVRRAAILGLIGALIGLGFFLHDLPENAARQHTGVMQALRGDARVVFLMYLCALSGFALASAGSLIGWYPAAVGVIVGALRGLLFGRFTRIFNPLHMLVAGLWIGTLFVLVTAGLSIVLRDEPARNRRGPIVAEMVHGFSPLALACGTVLIASGLIIAWQHLGKLPALWSTPYGYALIAKLCVVAVVFSLGAWNWRRQRPSLGTEDAAHSIRRSSTGELIAAGIVLLITSIVVSLPAPARAGGAPAATPPAAAPPG